MSTIRFQGLTAALLLLVGLITTPHGLPPFFGAATKMGINLMNLQANVQMQTETYSLGLGAVQVPADKRWGAQTQRSLQPLGAH